MAKTAHEVLNEKGWELVASASGMAPQVYRIPVPGGWLYTHPKTLVFVADPGLEVGLSDAEVASVVVAARCGQAVQESTFVATDDGLLERAIQKLEKN